MNDTTNKLCLVGKIMNEPQARYSPAGLGHLEFLLEHQSAQYMEGQSRQIYCKLPVVVGPELFQRWFPVLKMENEVSILGILNLRKMRSGATEYVLYAQHIETI